MDKRLTAYAFLKDSYDKANGVTTHAFRDMFETVLVKQSGKQFDSDQFSKDMTEIYGVHIPTRAIHGLLVHMREMGLVNFEDKKGSVAHVSVIDDDKYKRDDPLIETIVEELEDFCDELGCDKFEVDVRFFEWVRSLAFLRSV